MRSTKASAAVTRLNQRDPAHRYSMGISGNGLFHLLRIVPGSAAERVSEDLSQEDFVALVNRTGPQKVVRTSPLDAAFARQLKPRK